MGGGEGGRPEYLPLSGVLLLTFFISAGRGSSGNISWSLGAFLLLAMGIIRNGVIHLLQRKRLQIIRNGVNHKFSKILPLGLFMKYWKLFVK